MPNEETKTLTAVNLKGALWDTLQGVKSGRITPGAGDAVAAQAREILRTTRTQLAILTAAAMKVNEELIDFATKDGK